MTTTRLASRWPLILAAIFCTYSVVLLWDAFHSNEQLKAAADARLIADSKRRASALSDFAADMYATTQELAEAHEVRTYLINKALGMSPRYGLNANLDAIEQRFQGERDIHKQGSAPLLRRIAYLDPQGEPLVDNASGQGAAEVPAGALSPSSGPATGVSMRVDIPTASIVTTVPVLFKGEPAGSIVAVADLSLLHRFLISIDSEASYRETLLTADGRDIRPPGEAHAVSPGFAALLLQLPEDTPVALSGLADPRTESHYADSIAIKTSVAGMPLALVTTISSDEIYGRLTSPLFLYSLSLFPVLVVLAALRMNRLQARTTSLAIQAARSDSRRQILQEQNTELSEEIRRREAVERELQHHREHLEELVAQRTAELNSLFLALPDLYFRLQRDGTILDYRSGDDSDLYVSPDVFLGKRMQDVLPPEASRQTVAALEQIATGSDQCRFEYGLPVKAGYHYYEARVLPLDEEQLVIVVRNVTEQHMVEEAREANRQEAERLARVKSEFLANMSHEIRTPLNGILGMAQVGYRESEGRSKSINAFSKILESGRLLLGIINDILDFSKIEAGKLALESVPFDLQTVIRHAAEVVEGRVQAKGIALSVRLAPDLPRACVGDPLRLEQVLLNLLSNAVKFTQEGGILLDASKEDGQLVLRITDTGIGMSEAQVARLFVPFEQADGSTTRRFGGTGLGLAIVKRLVELMGGRISVESRQAHGTTFEVWVPLAEAPSELVARHRPPPAPAAVVGARRLAGLRILVAEDTEVNQLVLEAFLGSEGAEVVTAGDGLQAVEQIATEGPDAFDLVLMDIQMPVMDGYEATSRLRALAPRLPIIGQTAHAMAEERRRCLEAGMVDHVAKPIDVEDLVAVVLRHAGKAVLPAVSETDATKAAPACEVAMDWNAFEARFGAKAGFGEKLAATLLSSQEGTPQKLREAVQAADFDAMAFLAHSLKGVTGSLGLTEFHDLAAEAESAARQRRTEAAAKVTALITPIEDLLEKTAAFLVSRETPSSEGARVAESVS